MATLGLLWLVISAAAPEAQLHDQRVVVRFWRPPDPASSWDISASPELAKLGLSVVQLRSGQSLEQLRQVAGFDYVQTIQRVRLQEVTPNDPFWPQQYGPMKIRLPQAWDNITGAPQVIIAVVDTGIDLDHPDLQAKLVTGLNLIDEGQPPEDDHGHGTHVAGIAAASTDNAVGIAGANWGARLMPIKVLDQTGNGDDADVAAAMIWSADHGADVINLSLGGPCPSPVMELAATYAYTMGVTVVAATGNQNGAVLCPAATATVIAVAASDTNNVRASFSNIGPEVDLTAPGVGILSTGRGGGYEYRSGTSMATPYVAGVAALLAGLPQFGAPSQIRSALEATARDMGALCRDYEYGAGLIQADAALQYDPATVVASHCHMAYLSLVYR